MLTPKDVTGILRFGGTILGTTNKGNPFDYPVDTKEGKVDYSDKVVATFQEMRLDALVVIGGDGTLEIAHQFHLKGIPLVGVPKTIDNDIWGTTSCFGFDTAVSFAAEAIDRLHTTAEAHRRIMVVEVMGRYAGWIALHAGVAGGADVILMPEIAYDLDKLVAHLRERESFGARFSIVVVAEGATPVGGKATLMQEATMGHVERLGGVGALLAAQLQSRDRQGNALRGARPSSARRPADGVRSRARDALWRQSRASSFCVGCTGGWSRIIRPTSCRFRCRTWSGRSRRCRLTTICCGRRGPWPLGLATEGEIRSVQSSQFNVSSR